jgi:hypothetical protein
MRAFRPGRIAVLLVLSAGCSKPASVPDRAALEAAATARLRDVPLPDPQKYRTMVDMKNWRNPYFVVLPEGIALLDFDNNERRLLKPDDILQTLAGLPASAWPYGRVVAITESGITGGEKQRVDIRRYRGILAGTLEGAHVEINWVPSA